MKEMKARTNNDSRRSQLTRYEYTWRNKWLTADAKSIDDMIDSLQAAADELRELKARGVTLDPNGGTQNDYAMLITEDPAVAREFAFADPRVEDNDPDRQ